MPYITDETNNVFFKDDKILYLVGMMDIITTVRIDSEKVADITKRFDLELGKYVEVIRTEREEPAPPEPESDADRIARLEAMVQQLLAAQK